MASKKQQPRWSDFEASTKIGLEALGYKVERDVLLAGSQIDIYAHQQMALREHRILVECKDHDSPLGVKDVREFAALVQAVSQTRGPVDGLLISRSGFAKTARTFAEAANLQLMTLEDLLGRSFDPTPTAEQIIQDFEDDPLSSHYVDLSCQVTESGTSTIYKPVERFLDSFLPRTSRPGVAILGNFGSGKTALCKHYSYLLAKRWQKAKGNVLLPLYINLRDFAGFENLAQDIFGETASHLRTTNNVHGFLLWIQHRPTLLVLDGFDEMASRMNKPAIDHSIRQLMRFVAGTQAKIMLTCRTHFFRTQVEENLLGNSLKLYIKDWGPSELEQYVKMANAANAPAALRIIRSTYNLEDLSKTPIFLNMISLTIEQMGGRVNKSKLYQIYTDRWIESQEYRSRLLPEDVRQFMQDLAMEMHVRGTGRIHYKLLPARIGASLGVRDYDRLREFDNDVRTCSFLVREDTGCYYFRHKSYMEYFCAFKLAEDVKKSQFKNLAQTSLTPEVAGFFAEYFEKDQDVIVRSLLGNADAVVRANCALALGFFGHSRKLVNALSLSLETEAEATVKESVIDSLIRMGAEDCIGLAVQVAEGESSLSCYALRGLGGKLDDSRVHDLHRRILESHGSGRKALLALENISQTETQEMDEALLSYARSRAWKADASLATALVNAIAFRKDRDLALLVLEVERVANRKESRIADENLIAAIQQAKDELRSKFQQDVRLAAERNMEKGLTYRRNEGALRRRFSFLIDENNIRVVLGSLYAQQVRGGGKGKKPKRPS